MECGYDPSPIHIFIHQMLDRLEVGVNLLLISSDGTIALVHRCYLEVANSIRRQGSVSITPEVEPPLVPPLVG
jgi:hypothetical protein